MQMNETLKLLPPQIGGLVEAFDPSDAGGKNYYVRGRFATIEQRNNNKRFYPRELWEREVARYQDEIKHGTINTLMEWEHPENRLEVDPKKSVAKITKLWIDGDYVMGEAVIFDNTEQAETLKSMIKHGVQISVSSRASGRTDSSGVVTEFKLITFDLVARPSDQSATMYGIFESVMTQAYERDLILESKENSMDSKRKLVENLVAQLREKDQHIQDLKEELEVIKNKFEENKQEEELEYDMRRQADGLSQIHRHQDVSGLHDTDPSGEYTSGEDFESHVRQLVHSMLNNSEFVGSTLGVDTRSPYDGIWAKVGDEIITESDVQQLELQARYLEAQQKLTEAQAKAKERVEEDKEDKEKETVDKEFWESRRKALREEYTASTGHNDYDYDHVADSKGEDEDAEFKAIVESRLREIAGRKEAEMLEAEKTVASLEDQSLNESQRDRLIRAQLVTAGSLNESAKSYVAVPSHLI